MSSKDDHSINWLKSNHDAHTVMTVPFFYYLRTYGCTQNQAEGELMRVFLEEYGGVQVEQEDLADLVVINSCAVKQPTEHKVIAHAKRVDSIGKPLVVAGCLPRINEPALRKAAGSARILPVNAGAAILKHLPIPIPGIHKQAHVSIPHVPVFHIDHPKSAMLPVAQGCLGNCSFCAVKFARGRLQSYDHSDLIEYGKKAIEAGAREIWLTAQDTAAYGRDGDKRINELIADIADLPGDFRIRVGMMNPEWVMDIIEGITDVLQHPKVYRFLHIPVQSGNNKVLREMNRRYTVEQYRGMVSSLKRDIPEICISTDIIVGFPGESEEEFEDTMRLFGEIAPDVVNVSRYGDRPRTASSQRNDHVNHETMKDRAGRMHELVAKICSSQNQRWVGTRGTGFVTKKIRGASQARNQSYRPVLLPNGEIGELVEFEVTKSSATSLFGRTLSRSANRGLVQTPQ